MTNKNVHTLLGCVQSSVVDSRGAPPGRAWRAAYPSWSEAATVPKRRKSKRKTGKIWQVEPSHWPCGLAALFVQELKLSYVVVGFRKAGTVQ